MSAYGKHKKNKLDKYPFSQYSEQKHITTLGVAPMRYGFVIDQRACIGCHACTVACKAENEVPLGVFRTWVKYVEKGEFPNSRRHFLVERCNHCENAPCVQICPTGALFKRPDGIVDFDKDRCIGCKSCMQACPYDAIYIDPETLTAAKCHFCAHRLDVGLQPACVLVCPEEAIIFGDLDDPTTRISQLVGRQSVQVRRPEQGTKPKLFYIGADETALMPEALPQPLGAMWNEPTNAQNEGSTTQASPWLSHTEHAQVDYNVPHKRPWGWRVSAYLLTKSLASGLFLVLAALLGFGVQSAGMLAVPGILAALFFLGLTAFFLVVDLKRPDRFLYTVFKPQWGSWLTRGTYILVGYGALLVLWVGLWLFASPGVPLSILVGIAAVFTSIYTAFLFGQAEGRDLWQEPLLPASLLAQAIIAGSAGLAFGAVITSISGGLLHLLSWILLGAVLTRAALIALSLAMPHPTANAAWGARELLRGAQARQFWVGGVAAGIILPVALLGVALASVAAAPFLIITAGLLALVGLVAYEDALVRAGQAAPLS
jgi:Fe-S-cluster-containing dehydrogenase component/formate-dependent nitrite reductase membrane component NrfD